MSQLVKAAGLLLRPHLPLLVPALLEAAGQLEPLALNHLSVRLAGDQQSQDLVDTLRASAAKSHHTTDTVSKVRHFIVAKSKYTSYSFILLDNLKYQLLLEV